MLEEWVTFYLISGDMIRNFNRLDRFIELWVMIKVDSGFIINRESCRISIPNLIG